MRLSPFSWFIIGLSTLMLAGVTLFAAVSYRETRNAMISEFQAALREETTALETIYQLQGHKALIEVVTARANANLDDMGNEAVAVYLLTDAKGKKLAGNLAYWPTTEQAVDESSLQFIDPATGDTIVAVVFLLYADQRLLVGRRAVFEQVGQHLWRNYALLVGAVLFVSVGGVWVFTRALRQRLGYISATAERIRRGHLDERIPQSRRRDEIEALIGQLNLMLDQVEKLMEHARTTSSAIAHDLRHPISRLRNELEVLVGETQEPSTRARVETLTADIDSILRIFQAVLRLGRLEAGAYALQLEEAELTELVVDAISLYEPIAENMGRHIHFSGMPATWRIDRDLVFQAVANMLENALSYGAGDILVQVEGRGVIIRDHGEGIAAEDIERVLEPFVRLDESRSSAGSGLGLSLVRAIMEAHGGTLALADAHPGLCATLDFTPVVRPKLVTGASRPKPEA
ncbi:MAG: HAMP domain-containing histidine kinase [Chitinimonas sp.]|nr:HAMP domain-containing histidine kinase [Chitinimonas sp.]